MGVINQYCLCFVNFDEWSCTAPPPPPTIPPLPPGTDAPPDDPPPYYYSYPPAAIPEYPDNHKYMIISYCCCVFLVVAITCYAFFLYWRSLKQRHHDQNLEEFCTARGTQSLAKISYSFFASAVGAWVITAPASFAVFTGIVGLASYAISAGLPVLILAVCGAAIQARHENILSIGDFVGRRFGPVMKTTTALICIFVMSISVLAEYTTIGALFQDYVGSVDYPMIILVGVLTMTYTCAGGLVVSIATDQLQALATITLITILTIYVACTFREPLPKPIPNEPFPLGPNKYGYGTIFSMPVALMSATVFSEALWQKCWASRDRKTLLWGGTIGCCLITIAVFLFGFGGWLAAWGGLITYETNWNLYLFQVFAAEQNEVVGASAMVTSWVGVITLILATVMNTSAIDSFQNGISSAISTQWFKDQHVLFPRLIVLSINIPLMVVALQDYPVINLFLLSNMITTCCFIPVLIGVFTDKLVTESGAIFSICVAILTSLAYGIGESWQSDRVADSFECGAWYTFFGNQSFEYLYFVFACVGSIAGLIIWEGSRLILLHVFKVKGVGISEILGKLPGFKYITGSGFGVDLLDYQPFKWLTMGKLHGPLHGKEKASSTDSSSESDDPKAVGQHESNPAYAAPAEATPPAPTTPAAGGLPQVGVEVEGVATSSAPRPTATS